APAEAGEPAEAAAAGGTSHAGEAARATLPAARARGALEQRSEQHCLQETAASRPGPSRAPALAADGGQHGEEQEQEHGADQPRGTLGAVRALEAAVLAADGLVRRLDALAQAVVEAAVPEGRRDHVADDAPTGGVGKAVLEALAH